MRFQAGQGQLQVERTFAVNNNSKPPRTQMNEHNLEFYVPDGATITEGQAMTAGGQPVKSAPVPEDNAKNRYAFLFPLRPGETRFNVVYTVPYTGSANIDPKSVYPLEHFVAIAPKSMQFSAAPGRELSSRTLPRPARRQRRSSFQHATWASPWRSNFPAKARWRRPPMRTAASPGSGIFRVKPKTDPAAVSDRPSTLPILCRNIAGTSSADSRWCSLSAAVFVASRQQAANRAARAQGRALPALEDDEDYRSRRTVPSRARVRAKRRPLSTRNSPPRRLPPCCSKP